MIIYVAYSCTVTSISITCPGFLMITLHRIMKYIILFIFIKPLRQRLSLWRQQDLSKDSLTRPEQQPKAAKPNDHALPGPQPKKSLKPRITFPQKEIDTLSQQINARHLS